MPVNELDQMLLDSAVEVLETMFFTAVAGDAAPEDSTAPRISARLTFRGNRPGTFGVRVPRETGRRIAASFLGQEEESLSESQIGEVICELANMLCGSVLSRLEKDTRFELALPEIAPQDAGCPDAPTACRLLELEDGTLAMWLALGQAL
jgi:CheY-specific phosphatase CheX